MYSFSDNLGDMVNVDVDLRKELDLLTEEFSIDILYIRNNKFVRCSCFNDLEKTGDVNCKLCFGSGYFASIQKIKSIESTNSAYNANNKMQVQPIGAVERKDQVFYFNYKEKPKERDFILKVTWKNNKPIDVIKVLEVVSVYEMRGTSGRVEAFGASVENRPDKVKLFDSMLKRFPNKASKALEKGGKYIWSMSLLTQENEIS